MTERREPRIRLTTKQRADLSYLAYLERTTSTPWQVSDTITFRLHYETRQALHSKGLIEFDFVTRRYRLTALGRAYGSAEGRP